MIWPFLEMLPQLVPQGRGSVQPGDLPSVRHGSDSQRENRDVQTQGDDGQCRHQHPQW